MQRRELIATLLSLPIMTKKPEATSQPSDVPLYDKHLEQTDDELEFVFGITQQGRLVRVRVARC